MDQDYASYNVWFFFCNIAAVHEHNTRSACLNQIYDLFKGTARGRKTINYFVAHIWNCIFSILVPTVPLAHLTNSLLSYTLIWKRIFVDLNFDKSGCFLMLMFMIVFPYYHYCKKRQQFFSYLDKRNNMWSIADEMIIKTSAHALFRSDAHGTLRWIFSNFTGTREILLCHALSCRIQLIVWWMWPVNVMLFESWLYFINVIGVLLLVAMRVWLAFVLQIIGSFRALFWSGLWLISSCWKLPRPACKTPKHSIWCIFLSVVMKTLTDGWNTIICFNRYSWEINVQCHYIFGDGTKSLCVD